MFIASTSSSQHQNLLVINYVMDLQHPALSHQADVVSKLGAYYKRVIVITGFTSDNLATVPENIEIISTNWTSNHPIRNVIKFIQVLFRTLVKNEFHAVFSHMAIPQAAIASPFLNILGKKHVVWYAHASNSLLLKWTHWWSDLVVSSTRGSFPFMSKKVRFIGQGIDPNFFSPDRESSSDLFHVVHAGRLDPSKRILDLIETINEARKSNDQIKLTLIGDASSVKNRETVSRFIAERLNTGSTWLRLLPAVPRIDLPEALKNYGTFLHAFEGSLDKTLIEATMMELKVVTTNREYQAEFGTWSNTATDLLAEFKAMASMSNEELQEIVSARREKAIERHSLPGWIENIVESLNE